MLKKSVGIILAAGSGKRMKRNTPKQFLDINGRPMLYYSLKAFEESPVDSVVLVLAKEYMDECKKNVIDKYHFKKVKYIVEGGAERYDSSYMGLLACRDDKYDIVLIHDSGRPMVTVDVITQAINAASSHKACVIAVPTKDTIKIADDKGYCDITPDRKKIWSVQTPQAFDFKICMSAYEKLMQDDESKLGITDDAMVVERMLGVKVKLCMGDYRNIKVTTPEDLDIASVFLNEIL